MLQFDYAARTISSVDLRDEIADARHRAIMAPIIINTYGGRSFSGFCPIHDHDTSHARYLRAWNRSQQATNSEYMHSNGYLP